MKKGPALLILSGPIKWEWVIMIKAQVHIQYNNIDFLCSAYYNNYYDYIATIPYGVQFCNEQRENPRGT